jgi:large subunit ribosomal protein L24
MSLIKRGDLVEVITGPYRGERGEVLEVNRRTNRAVVKGLNMRVKHLKVRPTEHGGQTGGITEMEAPIDLSNIMIVDPQTQKPARLGSVRGEDGKRKRVTRGRNSSGTVID